MARERTNDLVVVVPGILGSRLADSDGKEIWGLSGSALLRGIRTFGGSVKRLTLPPDIGDDHPGDGVRTVGVMRDVHALPGVGPVIDGYTGLLDWLEQHFTVRRRQPGEPDSTPANLVAFAYDWRLSCRYNAARLKARIDEELGRWRDSAPERSEARVVFICHSMGGLVTRHYVEVLGGAETTREVITLGTPYRGSLDALLYLVNGLRRGWGPLSLDLTAFARSLPSLHQLTPDYACLQSPGGLRYTRELPGLPGLDPELLKDAAAFHTRLRERPSGAAYLPIVGVLQPTPTTAGLSDELLLPLNTIDGIDEGGDGRVPRLSAGAPVPKAVHTPCEQHGSLQSNAGVRAALWNRLAPGVPYHRGVGGSVQLGVQAPELLGPGEAYDIAVTVPDSVRDHDELAVRATVTPVDGAGGREESQTLRNLGDGRYATSFPRLGPGPYRVAVVAAGQTDSTVTALVLVSGPEAGDE